MKKIKLNNNRKNQNNNENIKIKNKENQLKEENKTKLIIKKLPTKSLEEKFSKNNIIIAVRVRPLNKKELEDSDYKTIRIIDRDTLTISIPTEYSFNENTKGKNKLNKENKLNVTKEKQATYKYDFVFGDNINQEQIYKYTSSNLIKQVIEGYNATIFAYGATGTGKTYTMLGNGLNVGIMIRAIKDLFLLINNKKDKKYIIKISYIEIYNEIIKDLLSNNNSNSIIELRNDPQKGTILQGVELKNVLNENEAFNIILKGNKKRTEKYTEFNENSSRSHAILQINLDIEDKEIKMEKEIKFGKFMLLDLAGSEKASFNYNSKGNNELGSINKSLLALNKCITLLTSQNRKFIPWRESKLTRLLQDSLSGNSRVVMISTISQALVAFDETMFTLQYANRAKNLKVNIKKNIVKKVDVRINKYDEFIQNIKEEIVDIKKNILEQDNAINNNKSDTNLANNYINNINNVDNNNNDLMNLKKEKNKNKDLIKGKEKESEIDKIIKEMLEHFDQEIKLKRKIIEKENIIEDLKNELSQQEYEILHAAKINLHYLKKQLQAKKEDIKEKQNKMMKGYIKQNELSSKRKEYQKIISNLVNKEPNNPEFYKLYNVYKYNINLLENMTIEHKKYINILESKRKDKKIEGLIEQLDLRDQFIRNAYYQFEKNDIEFKYKNPKLISSNQLENIPYRPKIIKIAPATSIENFSFRNLVKKTDENNSSSSNNISKNNEDSGKKKIRKVIISNYEKKRIEKIEKLENVKKQLMRKVDSSKKRQYNSEILSLFHNHPVINKTNKINGLNINDFIRNKKIDISNSNNCMANERSLNNKSLSDNNLVPIKTNNKRVHFILKPNIINITKYNHGPLSDRVSNQRYKNNSLNKLNDNNMNQNNNLANISLTSKLENEVQKKVKTILNKNYIGRYKSSPYLKFLSE